MGSLNRVQLIGYLGRDAELRYTPGGDAVSNFSIATSESFKDRQGQKQERTEWHKIVLWGKVAEALQDYLTKGKQVYLEGQIQSRKYKSKEGEDKTSYEIRADRIVLLGGGSGERTTSRRGGRDDQRRGGTDEDGSQERENTDGSTDGAAQIDPDDDLIPF